MSGPTSVTECKTMSSTTTNPWDSHFSLTPILQLPEVDLSISVRSRFVKNAMLQRILRAANASILTTIGFLIFLASAITVFFVPASHGGVIGVVGAVAGLPGAVVSIALLRCEVILLLLRTYDVWFFGAVSTVVAVLTSVMLSDARCLIMIISSLSFFINIFTDASTVGVSRIWISQMMSAVCYIVINVAVGAAITDKLNFVEIFHFNGHSFPAAAITRNGLSTMVVVIVRNLYREYTAARSTSRVATTEVLGVECVSYRCRLRVCIVEVETMGLISRQPSANKIAVATESSPAASSSKKTRLHFIPFFRAIHARNTLLPDRWNAAITCRDRQTTSSRRVFLSIGFLGFSISSLATFTALVAPELAYQREVAVVAKIGTSCTVLFVSICMASTQREPLFAVMTSFDFLFIAVQGTIVHLALVDLVRCQPVMGQAMFSSWLWSTWMMCWDAILPPARQTLGLKTRFAAWVGIGLIVILVSCTSMTVLVIPPDMINDRVVLSFQVVSQTIEVRPYSWYVSCSASISAWSIRVMWRLCQANEDELVVLDGPVVYQRRMQPCRQGEPSLPKVPDIDPARPTAPHAVFPAAR